MKKDVLTISFLDIRSKLHRIAMRFLQNDEDAKDALQDTFEKLWSKDEIESNAEARNKLVHVLRNTCIDRLRTNHSVPLESAETDFEGGYETPTEDMERYERLIVKGLTRLSNKFRRPLFFFWGNVALPSGYRIPCFLNLGLSAFIPNTATA